MAAGHVQPKSYAFALEVVGVVQALQSRKEFVLSAQPLKAGTSIGANVEEAGAGQTKREFIMKMSIASKEARETRYWLRLLRDGGYLTPAMSSELLEHCEELIRMLTAIVKTAQSREKRR
jgi:four helix bundle protein